ncbi:hypothetical protein ACKXGF_02760 [Alkalibacillus sp. S2W]|uniref:hypothetical protein n=1 Tax=Alkalibacillus sp. S2W TaxID=3386553 RepID=UPI00398CBE6D
MIKETNKQYDFFGEYSESHPVFSKAMLIIIHSFTDLKPRDLDNYYYKPVIDTVKHLNVITDDTWSECSITVYGRQDTKNYIEVVVVPHDKFLNFMQNTNIENLNDVMAEETNIQPYSNIKRKREETLKFFGD